MHSHRSIEIDERSRQLALAENFLNLNRLIDHTLLKPDARQNDYQKLFLEAAQYAFRTVCVPPAQVKNATEFFKKQSGETEVCTVIGFPLGYSTTTNKVNETEEVLTLGATEIDFVQNVTLVKNAQWGHWEHECSAIVTAAQGRLVKIILETSLLTEEEITECTSRAALCGVHTIKTSTGFGSRGASLRDIELIVAALKTIKQKNNRTYGIKASGGIRTQEDARAMISAGATRVGTSQGVSLCTSSKS